MNWLQWFAASGILMFGFALGYLKGYENAKELWYVKGRRAIRKELGL